MSQERVAWATMGGAGRGKNGVGEGRMLEEGRRAKRGVDGLGEGTREG